jgi:hypothetical protein
MDLRTLKRQYSVDRTIFGLRAVFCVCHRPKFYAQGIADDFVNWAHSTVAVVA